MGWVFLLFLVVAVALVVGAIVFRARLINFFFQPANPAKTTSIRRAFTIKPPEHDDVFQCGSYKSVLARRWAAKKFGYQPGEENGKAMPVVSLRTRATSQEPADKTTAGVD
jgi:hypothetical protein